MIPENCLIYLTSTNTCYKSTPKHTYKPTMPRAGETLSDWELEVMTPPIVFNRWGGEDGLEEYIKRRTGCKPFSGAGINPRPEQKTTILKSVDDTFYYDDDLSDPKKVKYTMFGHSGDQSEANVRFNEPLLNKDKTQHIYLYRVRITGKSKDYIWYGKYEIVEKNTKQHVGKDYNMRNIIVLTLKKIGC